MSRRISGTAWPSRSSRGPTDATARDVATANRKGLAARMTESELADAQQAATEWKPK